MNKNYTMGKEAREFNYYKEMYQKMISKNVSKSSLENLVNELIKCQKEDGSWSVIDNYRVDSDIVVHYAFVPTYFATAALIYADLQLHFNQDSIEKRALLKGLDFAKRREFAGHGFDATASLLDTLAIYKKADVYKWIKKNNDIAPEFCNIFSKHINYFRNSLETGRTISDWDRDFKKEFEKEVADYDAAVDPYVWYAAYGSNINKNRFMQYINSCSDKSAPIEDMPYIIPYELYFASISRTWDHKGVAFINDNKYGVTLGRVYKITMSQFLEIQSMEGSKYTKKVKLEDLDGIPVFTFTSVNVRTDIKEASVKYMETIKSGLKEVYPDKSDLFLDVYLYTRGGLQAEDIKVLSQIRNSAHAVTLKSLTSNELCMTKLKPLIKKLYYYGFIVQDRRSIQAGCDELSPEAVVYTNRSKRELIDFLIITRY